MLLHEFKRTKLSAVLMPTKLNIHVVVAFVNMGSAKIVILKSCFDFLGLISNNEVEFTKNLLLK